MNDSSSAPGTADADIELAPDRPDIQALLAETFDAAYYLSQNPDVALAGMDPLEHYKSSGWREWRRPNSWFDPAEYVARHPELNAAETNPFLHFLAHRDQTAAAMAETLSQVKRNQLLYWSDLMWESQDGPHPVVISMPLPGKSDIALAREVFDAAYYLETNPDVAARKIDPLLHFLTIGWIERRDPSPDFSLSYYLNHNRDIREQRINPYLHYLRYGRNETWRRKASVAEAAVMAMFEEDEAMLARVAAATALEPMVALPNEPRRMTSVHIAAKAQTDAAETLRKALAGRKYRYIVTVPHVRMSGASRVASIFTEALAEARDPSEILVLTTDSSEREYIDWFPEGVDRFDLSAVIAPLNPEAQIRCLIDVMRGVGCRTLVNVNSRLAWEALRLFGRQLSKEFRTVTYLFTWDENPKGARVGYPIQWLRDTADYHHLLLTDTANLARDVSERLGFGDLPGEAVVRPLYTPAQDTGARAQRKRRSHEPARILWAGRFDRQKRVDLLVAIARDNPHLIFDVYGKTVLDQRGLEAYDPPDNIVAKGTYKDLSEVFETAYAGFLYTAQWDGLPTILLDMASAGLPIVASNVGGIGELIDAETGWLVDDIEDIAAYGAALNELVSDPSGAARRAKRLTKRLKSDFTQAGYVTALKEMVTDHDL